MPDLVPFNLITSHWIPAIRASHVHEAGVHELISIAELTSDISGDNPPVDLAPSRPDFRLALYEFLIGILTVALAADSKSDWQKFWQSPPTPGALAAALQPFESCFGFDTGRARAFQDLEELVVEPTPIEALLIEAPGASTIKKNSAILVKGGRIETLSRAGAAMALITMQNQAPAGGAGIRTSLRGGGPLVTLVIPGAPSDGTPLSLWHRLWANVARLALPAVEDFPRLFPWLVPTRTGRVTTPEDVHPLQCFFGLPRRIRLDFVANTERHVCDLTGIVDDVVVRTYRTRPQGTNYDGWSRGHPLTPYYKVKAADVESLPVHPRDGRLGYRQWAALVYGTQDGLRFPASCIDTFRQDRAPDLPVRVRKSRLMAAGYAMDNMKALAFVETEMPLHLPHAQKAADALMPLCNGLVEAATLVSSLLVGAVRRALFGEKGDVDRDATVFASVRERLFDATTDEFFALIDEATIAADASEGALDRPAFGERWRSIVTRTAFGIFDDTAPILAVVGRSPRDVVEARKSLFLSLRGFGKRGNDFFKALNLPAAETKARKGKTA